MPSCPISNRAERREKNVRSTCSDVFFFFDKFFPWQVPCLKHIVSPVFEEDLSRKTCQILSYACQKKTYQGELARIQPSSNHIFHILAIDAEFKIKVLVIAGILSVT